MTFRNVTAIIVTFGLTADRLTPSHWGFLQQLVITYLPNRVLWKPISSSQKLASTYLKNLFFKIHFNIISIDA